MKNETIIQIPVLQRLISVDSTSGAAREFVGGKAWNLARLSEGGFPVPDWFVISSDVFDEVRSPIREAVRESIGRINPSDMATVAAIGESIRKLVLGLSLPLRISKAIKEMQLRQGGSLTRWAVRSSVVDEDGHETSFAGMMDSFLNVPGSEVSESVIRVWASAYSDRAMAYRVRQKRSIDQIKIAVIVQQFIPTIASGVLFTRNPESGNDDIVVTAVYGLGEGAVADKADADEYRIVRINGEIAKKIATKRNAVVVASGHAPGMEVRALPAADEQRAVLSNQQIAELAEIGRRIEALYGEPVDIEWGVGPDGRVVILQTRPITALRQVPPQGEFRVWENANIVESYPGLTLPLTFSFIREAYEVLFRRATGSFLLRPRILGGDAEIFREMVGLIRGRVYYNLLNWYRMLSYLPGWNRRKDSWDRMIGIAKKIPFPETELRLVDRVWAYAVFTNMLLAHRIVARRFIVRFNKLYSWAARQRFESMPTEESIAVYHKIRNIVSEFWHRTLHNDLAAMTWYEWLRILSGRWIAGSNNAFHNNLLCGESDVESVRPVRAAIRIAEQIRSSHELMQLFALSSPKAIWEAITNEPRANALRESIASYMHEFGDRGIEELKFETRTYRDDPLAVVEMVSRYVQTDLSIKKMEENERKMRSEAEARVRASIRNPIKRGIFHWVLGNARRAVAQRENMRFARTRLYGVFRRIFRQLGVELASSNAIGSPDDVWYLTLDEVIGRLRGTGVTDDLTSIVRIRKDEYERYRNETLPNRIETMGIPSLPPPTPSNSTTSNTHRLQGIGCVSGSASGRALVVTNPRSANVDQSKILVAPSTDPGWVFLMIASSGLVVERGSILSHTAIIGRELGIPTIVGVAGATANIADGSAMAMDGSTGVVEWN